MSNTIYYIIVVCVQLSTAAAEAWRRCAYRRKVTAGRSPLLGHVFPFRSETGRHAATADKVASAAAVLFRRLRLYT